MILEFSSFGLGDNFSSCCYSVFSTNFPIPCSWRVSYIIWLPLDDPDPPSVDRLGHYFSACHIRHLPKPLVSWSCQDSIIQGSSTHKCSQEAWWNILNVVATTILSVMSRLTPSSKFFLYGMTSFSKCHWCGLTVQACGLLSTIMYSSAMDTTHGIGTLLKFLCPTFIYVHIYENKLILIV